MTTVPDANHLELTVSNLGPISEGKIQLRPMSVFVGPSNTGKSYLATLIYALHRFFGAYAGGTDYIGWYSVINRIYSMMEDEPVLSDDEIAVLLKWAKETNPNPIDRRHPSIWLCENELTGTVAELVRGVLCYVSAFADSMDEELIRCFGVGDVATLPRYAGNGECLFTLRRYTDSANGGGNSVGYHGKLTGQGVDIAATIAPNIPLRTEEVGVWHMPLRNFSWTDIFDDSRDGQTHAATGLLEILSRSVATRIVSPLTRTAYYLPANRSGIMQSHQLAVQGLIAQASRRVLSADAASPGLSGVLADFLGKLVALGDLIPRSQTEALPTEAENHTDLALHLERNVLGGTVKVLRGEIAYPSFAYRPDGWQRDLPLMNASSMVSELAPVVLYLRHVVQPGHTLIIEEPESHLHPAMQVEFVRLLAAAVKAGIRIIITTHSEWVLEELANLVLMSELPVEHRAGIEGADLALTPDEVGAWFFEPNADGSGSVVQEMPLDKESGNFPSGFGLITADLYNRYARISNRIERLTEE